MADGAFLAPVSAHADADIIRALQSALLLAIKGHLKGVSVLGEHFDGSLIHMAAGTQSMEASVHHEPLTLL